MQAFRLRTRDDKRAFTLIELLIVVAIIAILAAIAVPNFLEAQVRAKVSRVRSDQRTLATALESYYVDCNRYPPEGNPCDPTGAQGVSIRPASNWPLIRLTTPIAYMTSLEPTRDPFFTNAAQYSPTTGTFSRLSFMFYGNYTDFAVTRNSNPNALKFNVWYLSSLGPDHIDSAPGWRLWNFMSGQQLNALSWGTYDPTNGTISFGDIYRCGGEVPAPAAIIMGFK